MTKTTTKLADAAAPSMDIARARAHQAAHQMGDLMSTRVMPYADHTRRRMSSHMRNGRPRFMSRIRDDIAPKVTSRVRDDIAPRVGKAMRDDVVPKVAAAVGTAVVASAPIRREVMDRGRIAFAALRGDTVVIAKPRRRLRKFMIVLGVGAAVGGAVAWARSMMAGPDEDPYPTPGPDAWAPTQTSDGNGPDGNGPDGSDPRDESSDETGGSGE